MMLRHCRTSVIASAGNSSDFHTGRPARRAGPEQLVSISPLSTTISTEQFFQNTHGVCAYKSYMFLLDAGTSGHSQQQAKLVMRGFLSSSHFLGFMVPIASFQAPNPLPLMVPDQRNVVGPIPS